MVAAADSGETSVGAGAEWVWPGWLANGLVADDAVVTGDVVVGDGCDDTTGPVGSGGGGVGDAEDNVDVGDDVMVGRTGVDIVGVQLLSVLGEWMLELGGRICFSMIWSLTAMSDE
jgi:hypothetical protein